VKASVFNVSAILIHDTVLKAIVLGWRALSLSQRVIDKSTGEWRRRLRDEREGMSEASVNRHE